MTDVFSEMDQDLYLPSSVLSLIVRLCRSMLCAK
jgi:hypothetical protein